MPKTINGTGVSFTYNAFSERVKKSTSTNTTIYVDKFYENYGPTWYAKNIYAGNDLVTVKIGTATYYYHPDHLGSTSIVTDGSGNKVEDITYYPYGGTIADTHQDGVRLDFLPFVGNVIAWPENTVFISLVLSTTLFFAAMPEIQFSSRRRIATASISFYSMP